MGASVQGDAALVRDGWVTCPFGESRVLYFASLPAA
jgi:hypothetical protein